MADDTELLDGPEVNDSLAIRPNPAYSAPAPPDVAPPAAASPAMPIAPPVQPNMKTAILGSVGARPDPNAPQYQPVKPSLGNQILGRLAAGAVGFRNPQAGVALRHEQEQAPIITAQQKYGTDVNDYNARFNEALQTNNADTEGQLRQAQIGHTNAETQALGDKPGELQDVVKLYSHALATGDTATAARLKPAVSEYLATTKPPKADKDPNAIEDVRRQLVDEEGSPKPDAAKIKHYQQELKDLDPEGQQRISIQEERTHDTEDKNAAGPKPTIAEQNRADLAQNLNENLDALEEVVRRRPELFGPIAGRWTDLKGKFGSDDPDIAALQTLEHQIGMVQQSTHGMRSASGVQSAATSVTNAFHSTPAAMLGAIEAARHSAATFSGDVEQPETKPHAGGTSAGSKGGKTSASDLGDAGGKPEGATGTLPDGTKVKVVKGRIVKQ